MDFDEWFDKIIHQHHHENVAQIGSHEKPVFEFGRNQNFDKEKSDRNKKVS